MADSSNKHGGPIGDFDDVTIRKTLRSLYHVLGSSVSPLMDTPAGRSLLWARVLNALPTPDDASSEIGEADGK